MADIPTVHDSFFRSILADKQVAIAYFQSVLPEHIGQLLDFSTMKQLPGTYVSESLAKTIADVVYRCERKDGKGSVDISLLVEHKSQPRDASDEEIRALDHQFLMASLLSLKHAHDKEWLGRNFSTVLAIGLANIAGHLGQKLVVYSLHQAELSPEKVRKLTEKLPETIRRQVMSTYELLKAEGKAEGFELGAEQKSYEFVSNLLLAGKFTVAEIANYATVTEDFVQKVRADLSKKKK